LPLSPAPDNLDRPITAYVRSDFVSLHADQTVAQTLRALRGQNLGERVVYFYVVDGDGRLVGVLPTRRLLMAAEETRLADIMQRNVLSVPATATLLLACEMFVMHRLLAFPVVGDAQKLVGIIDVSLFTDEIFDLSERHSADDLFQLVGVRLAQSRNAKPWIGFRRRFPWLLCNVAGGLACAFLAGLYESFLDSAIILALFIPIVLALAESVSMQSMTLTLQAMHGAQVDWAFLRRIVGREFLTAALLGAGTGLLVGVVSYTWRATGLVAVAIAGTIVLSVVSACLLGVLPPAGVRACRGDPRIAAGPVVLAVADVATLLLYFNLAGVLLSR
jgi:magnesium transporter